MASGLSNLSIALIVVFIVSISALVAQLFYVLYRRRRIPTNNHLSLFSSSSPSKEQLIYLFCLGTTNHQSRIQPSNSSAPIPKSIGSDPQADFEDIHILKLQSFKEGGESEKEKKTIKEIVGEPPSDAVVLVVGKDEDDQVVKGIKNTTPFTTPCASPLFLTPSPSFTEQDFKSLPL